MDQTLTVSTGKIGNFMSVEAFVMIFVACLVDGGEVLLELIPLVGWILSALLDFFALFFFGFWMMLRSDGPKKITVPKKTAANIKKITVKTSKWAKRMKWIRPICFLFELIPLPFISSALPLWVAVVIMEIAFNSKN